AECCTSALRTSTHSSPFFFSYSRPHRALHSFPTRRSSDLPSYGGGSPCPRQPWKLNCRRCPLKQGSSPGRPWPSPGAGSGRWPRSEEHTSELQSRENLVCRLLLEKKKKTAPHTKSSHATIY